MTRPTNEKAVTLRLSTQLHEQLQQRADEEERSVNQLLRLAARRYLQTNEASAAPAR